MLTPLWGPFPHSPHLRIQRAHTTVYHTHRTAPRHRNCRCPQLAAAPWTATTSMDKAATDVTMNGLVSMLARIVLATTQLYASPPSPPPPAPTGPAADTAAAAAAAEGGAGPSAPAAAAEPSGAEARQGPLVVVGTAEVGSMARALLGMLYRLFGAAEQLGLYGTGRAQK